MAGVDPRRLVWGVHRGFLRHGIAFGLILACAAVALILAVVAAGTWWQLQQTDRALAAHSGELRTPARPTTADAPADVLPLPDAEQRFELTRRILASLKDAGFEPEQIRFKFEDLSDAGLLRQTAVLKLTARWNEIAQVLAGLQAADRSIYIAKLRLERETPGDSLVQAEIQLAVALAQGAAEKEGSP